LQRRLQPLPEADQLTDPLRELQATLISVLRIPSAREPPASGGSAATLSLPRSQQSQKYKPVHEPIVPAPMPGQFVDTGRERLPKLLANR